MIYRSRSFVLPSLLPWDHRKQQVIRLMIVEMQGRSPGEDRRRPVARVVVQERSAPRQLVLEVREPQPRRLLPFVIPPPHRQCDPASGRHDDGRWPELDVQIDRLARDEGLLFVMGVIGPPWF